MVSMTGAKGIDQLTKTATSLDQSTKQKQIEMLEEVKETSTPNELDQTD